MQPPNSMDHPQEISRPPKTDVPPPYVDRNTTAQPSTPREPTEHAYFLKDSKKVTLKLYSGAKSSKSLPVYFEREKISGSLEINAEKGDSIHSVTVKVVGRITTGARTDDILTFLSQPLCIWSKSTDLPRVVPSSSAGASGSKLLGRCEWPLSIPLPPEVTIPSLSGGPMQTYRLPETFMERQVNASVQYELIIVIGRGRFRSDSQIKATFAYIPHAKPEPASALRQLAYREHSPLPGPASDPEGWKTLAPVHSRGLLLPNHPVDVQCTVSLAKPLCYTRGTLIPCALKLESDDKNVLNIFAEPSAIVLLLCRRIRFFCKPSEFTKPEEMGWNESVEEVCAAVWWPSPDLEQDPLSRYLQGEIKLSEKLKPTSAMGPFSLSYFVVLRQFTAPYFSSEDQDLLSEDVEIATAHADGPRPHAYSDGPAHNPHAQRSEQSYLSSMTGYSAHSEAHHYS